MGGAAARHRQIDHRLPPRLLHFRPSPAAAPHRGEQLNWSWRRNTSRGCRLHVDKYWPTRKGAGGAFPIAPISAGTRGERLAATILDVLGPERLDGGHHLGGHRHEVEVFGHLAALGIGPGEELE